MSSTAESLARLRRFAREMRPDVPAVDLVLAPLRALLDDAGIAFKIVGGVAVVHHGYARTTEDAAVLVASQTGLDAALDRHGFDRSSPYRLRHRATGVVVDLLTAGAPLPRADAGTYPAPSDLEASSPG